MRDWSLDPNDPKCVICNRSDLVCYCRFDDEAQLIASAPLMLAALERFIAEVPAQSDIGIIAVKDQAREAIRKAKGEP